MFSLLSSSSRIDFSGARPVPVPMRSVFFSGGVLNVKCPSGPKNSTADPSLSSFRYVLPLPSSMSFMHSSKWPDVGLLEIEYERMTSGVFAGWGILIVTNWPALNSKDVSSVSKFS